MISAGPTITAACQKGSELDGMLEMIQNGIAQGE
jgi:hypothetical protein